ncbi:MAG: GNAT family N-acetyltransferase [Fimbriimonadaceae bacterium]|nr:GNAT family N-acetyltransferase [Fimbriimonadaceae bacterium]QYK54869.1 MAG: GNAT family N-acetyltransferase [Fimbriimonadaceae bacterium]
MRILLRAVPTLETFQVPRALSALAASIPSGGRRLALPRAGFGCGRRGIFPGVLIRPFRPGDTPAVVETVRVVYDEYSLTWDEEEYHADLFTIEEEYGFPENGFWVAEVDGEVVGCAGLAVFEPLPGDRGGTIVVEGTVRVATTDCEIVRVYVRPAARGKGIGEALSRTVISEAVERGRTAMEIWSDKRFHAAHRLYQRLGAQIVGDRVCDDPDDSPEWGLYLSLTS